VGATVVSAATPAADQRPVTAPVYDWHTLDWKPIEQAVFRLQRRIFQASRRGDLKAIHHLQRLLIGSRSARLLAVRRVTQDNRGKRTAGVDGKTVLSGPERVRLAEALRLPEQAPPVRRVWIPKPGTTEQRPLGIPTIRDRAAQALALLALEPQWEARFEADSYGFRPGRSAHDALEAIFQTIHQKAKFVLDADIEKCFDRIDHQALLAKLDTIPPIRRAVRAWLTAGVLDGDRLFPTAEGTPQGGVLSPLLANIALHGLTEALPATRVSHTRTRGYVSAVRLVRYADDFVVFHEDRAVLERTREAIEAWLGRIGLRLKPSKTRIAHTLERVDGAPPGFDFLGFTIRQFRVGQTHSGMNSRGTKRRGFKTITRPSRTSCQRHQGALRAVVRQHRAAPQVALIAALNPKITGWSRYFRSGVAKRAFSTMDALLFGKLRRWAFRRHPTKSRRWIVRKYWGDWQRAGWVFKVPDGPTLRRHAATPIVRHVKVRGQKSPYDGDWPYWSARMGKHPELSPGLAKLMHWQRGRCARCGLRFKAGDVVENDHLIPRELGGSDALRNRQLLHGHCHDAKTAEDLAVIRAASAPAVGCQ
jgi:RNA-directed DNA polymerase